MIIPIGFAELTFIFSGGNLPRGAASTIACEATGVQDPGVITTVAAPAAADLHEGLASADVTLASILCKLGPNETGPFLEQTIGVTGAQGSTTMTSQVALNVRKNTPVGGRRFRGRMFYPGVAEAAFDDTGQIEPAYLSQFQGALDTFVSVMDTAGYPLVLLHSDGGTTPTPITTLTVGSRTITQRRRNRRALV